MRAAAANLCTRDAATTCRPWAHCGSLARRGHIAPSCALSRSHCRAPREKCERETVQFYPYISSTSLRHPFLRTTPTAFAVFPFPQQQNASIKTSIKGIFDTPVSTTQPRSRSGCDKEMQRPFNENGFRLPLIERSNWEVVSGS